MAACTPAKGANGMTLTALPYPPSRRHLETGETMCLSAFALNADPA
jgi:hypothetical protein